MSEKSKLSHIDYEDFLVYLYFGGDDNLTRCIRRAYRDFNRTLHGMGSLLDKEQTYKQACDKLKESFSRLQSGQDVIADQASFDSWHKDSCSNLSIMYEKNGYPNFAVGQAQKWINMIFKYIFTLGPQRIAGFEGLYHFCHVPLDNILIDRLAQYGFEQLPSAWSRLNDYTDYLTYQKRIRLRFSCIPLDVEFWLWRNETLPPDCIAPHNGESTL